MHRTLKLKFWIINESLFNCEWWDGALDAFSSLSRTLWNDNRNCTGLLRPVGTSGCDGEPLTAAEQLHSSSVCPNIITLVFRNTTSTTGRSWRQTLTLDYLQQGPTTSIAWLAPRPLVCNFSKCQTSSLNRACAGISNFIRNSYAQGAIHLLPSWGPP